MSQMPPRKALLPLIWLKRGKGTRHCFHFNRRRHAWLSRVSQKIGSFGARCESERKLMCIWEKSRGEDFIGVKSLIFQSGCQSNSATAVHSGKKSTKLQCTVVEKSQLLLQCTVEKSQCSETLKLPRLCSLCPISYTHFHFQVLYNTLTLDLNHFQVLYNTLKF